MIKELWRRGKVFFKASTRSLKSTLLFWFLVLSIIPFIVVAWYGYTQTVRSVDALQRNKLSNAAALDVATLQEHFRGVVQNLALWSQLRAPEKVLKTLNKRYAKSNQTLLEFTHSDEYKKFIATQPPTILTLVQDYAYVNDLFLIDLNGNVLYSLKKESDLGTNLLNGVYAKTRFAQAYRKSLLDKKAHFSDIEHYPPSHNKLAGFITQPIIDTSGKMIGILGLQMNTDGLFAAIHGGKNGMHQYLVGPDGLLRTSMGRSEEILSRRIDTEVFWSWYKAHGIHGTSSDTMGEAASIYIGPDGKRVLGEHHSVNLLGVRWVHISEMDESEVRAVPHQILTTIVLFSLLIASTVIVMGILIARRIVKPIALLSQASEHYLAGDKGVHVTLDTDNEIGEFGLVFNALIQKQEKDEEKLAYLAHKAQKTLDELKEQKYALDAHAMVTITDVEGTITFANKKFEEISGYTSDELIGKNHRMLKSGLHSPEFWKEMYRTVMQGAVWHGEICNLAKNSTYYWVETTIVPFVDEHDIPISYIAIRTDITQRKAIQDSFNKAMQLQKAIFDNAGVSIITTDTEGLITGFNAAAERMLGYTAQEMVGKQTPAIIHKVDEVVARAQEFSEDLGEEVEPGFKVFVIKADYRLPNAYEWTYIRKDGSELPVYLNVTALYDMYEHINGYMGIASDVSLFKEAEAQMLLAKEAAEASVRVKSDFLATMSHEIRTPMNGVIGMLGLLSHSHLDETQRHQVRVASNSANSLLGLINDILDFSKVEAGKMELELIEFNLRDALEELLEANAFRAQEKGLKLILDTTGLTHTSVITDPGRLRQILTNLIGNAVKFTHRGEIVVRAMLDEADVHQGRLRIDVCDSGIGIAADKIESLFESFSQADNSTTRQYGGTGLGLAIVKKLCELMEGTIWVTSTEHVGSTFHIEVGVGLGEVSAVDIRVEDHETNRTVGRGELQWPEGTRLLLVEDNTTNQMVAQGILEMIGLGADLANNGLEALEAMRLALETVPYTLVLMDCQMPEMDGYTASIAIREGEAGERYKEVPIVAMTANAMADDREKCLVSGMNDYVSKPINLETLKTTLVKWLHGSVIKQEATVLAHEEEADTQNEETQELIMWDEADALNRLGGKKELLHKVIRSFIDECATMMEALEEAIREENLSHIQLQAHSIKGSAGNVSAQQLQALAKTMELAAKNGDKSVLEKSFLNLKKTMKAVCALFEQELSKGANPVKHTKQLNALDMAIQLQNLKKEIESGAFIDTEGMDIFDEYGNEAFTVHMQVLKGHIDRFETAQSLKVLETIMAGLE